MCPPRKNLKLLVVILALCGLNLAAQHKRTDEVTLNRCWEFPITGVVSLASDGKDVFAVLESGRVDALSASGEKLWETDLGGSLDQNISAESGLLTVRSLTGGLPVVKRLSTTTGLPIGVDSAAVPSASRQADLPETATSYAVTTDGLVYGNDLGFVSAAVGKDIAWRFRTGGRVSAVVSLGEMVIVISRDNFVYSLNSRNGGLRWKKRLQGRVGRFSIVGGVLLATALDQNGVSIIDLASGRLVGQLSFDGEDQLSADPLQVGGSVVLATSRSIQGFSFGNCTSK